MLFNNKRSEQSQFDAIVREYQQPIYWHIRRMVVNHDDANDVLQETFIRIFKSIDSLKQQEAMKSWIYRIATNEALRFLSSKKISEEELSEKLVNELADSEYVETEDEVALKFNKAILTLSSRQRAIFDLRYFDELSYQEIADITGGQIGTIKATYHQAKEKIKDYIINN